MPRKLQELRYDSFEECSSKYIVPDLKKQKINTLCKSAAKLYDEAEKQYAKDDEEQSFIYYMKYFNVFNAIRAHPDYLANKQYVNGMLGTPQKSAKAMDRAEKLSQSLRKRYELLKSIQKEDVPDVVEDIPEDITEVPEVIAMTSVELYGMIMAGGNGLFLFDCRSKDDFRASHIVFENCLNIPESAIMSGMSAGKISSLLSPADVAVWDTRGQYECIVLMDWSTAGVVPVRNTPLWIMMDIMQNYDPNVQYRRLTILNGGYEDFLLRFPMQTTNSRAKPPVSVTKDENSLEEIEYPNIEDIAMKTSFEVHPSFDRSTKAAALVTYEQKEKLTHDIQRQQEHLAEKVLTVEKERFNAEKVWEELHAKELLSAEQEKREQELLYNIMQYENQHKDIMAENERLKQQLSDIEAGVEETIAARIRDKDRERQLLQEKREQMEAEREEKLRVAREQKKLLENKENHAPVFNRSNKPQNIIFPQRGLDNFNFVPDTVERGLTGLQNLGNSCYMNSIIQCLGNTSSLIDYVLSDCYRKHINPKGNTKGRIIEELAAVLKALWAGRYRFFSPLTLKQTIGAVYGMFRGTEQQDAHEFLTILIDLLHNDLQTISTPRNLHENLPKSESAWLAFTKSRESAILRLFYGQIKSTVKCKMCGKESATYESFSNLSLELPATNARCSIENCFDMYFNGENISGWNCPMCQQSRDAVKKLDISKLPPILVIHFKRFSAGETSQYHKKQNFVNFPLMNLNLERYIARSQKNSPKIYNLYGISNHYGTMDRGHYTAFCRNSQIGKWFKFDDQQVSVMESGDVQSSAAYILFYTFLPLDALKNSF